MPWSSVKKMSTFGFDSPWDRERERIERERMKRFRMVRDISGGSVDLFLAKSKPIGLAIVNRR